MKIKEDVQLIHDILSGNDDAFSTLVQKYQKSVHALAWRKIRDFHYYVATDKGTLVSQTGEHWSVLTDDADRHPIIDRFTVDGATVYGVGDAGVYRLDAGGRWQQISSSVPDKTVSFVASKESLYIATQVRGMFYIPLETDSVVESSYGY